MDDAELYRRQLRSLVAIDSMMAAAGRDSTTIERDGASALIVPAAPGRSVLNSVCYDDQDALLSAYDELAAAYDDAGIAAWTVWAPRAHTSVAAFLEQRGHALDASPEVMCAHLDELDLDAGRLTGLDWTADAPLSGLVPVVGPAFGFDLEELGRALEIPQPGAYTYLAHDDGAAVSSVMTADHDGDCGIFWVATLEQARRRGLCQALMTAALLDARERGCETTSLQATEAGRPIYAKLGYRGLGPIDMWEKRRAT
jgi:ribosomal protein S18 acetylase RimI-like enzyme